MCLAGNERGVAGGSVEVFDERDEGGGEVTVLEDQKIGVGGGRR